MHSSPQTRLTLAFMVKVVTLLTGLGFGFYPEGERAAIGTGLSIRILVNGLTNVMNYYIFAVFSRKW